MPSPNYDPPTLAEMRVIVARMLRDPEGQVFGPDDLNDIIREGLADLSGYRPIEAIESAVYNPAAAPGGPGGPGVTLSLTLLAQVYQVELRNADVNATYDPSQAIILPYETGEANIRSGWDYFAGLFHMSRVLASGISNWYNGIGQKPLTYLFFGYRDRAFPTADAQTLDLQDATDYLCLVKSCRMLGYRLLASDRSLYQQWLAATNNTDVSPTQLQGMLNLAEGDYDRQRRRSSVYRRTPAVGPQYP